MQNKYTARHTISVPAGNGQAGRAPDSRETILSSSPDRRHFYYYITIPRELIAGPIFKSIFSKAPACEQNNSMQPIQELDTVRKTLSCTPSSRGACSFWDTSRRSRARRHARPARPSAPAPVRMPSNR